MITAFLLVGLKFDRVELLTCSPWLEDQLTLILDIVHKSRASLLVNQLNTFLFTVPAFRRHTVIPAIGAIVIFSSPSESRILTYFIDKASFLWTSGQWWRGADRGDSSGSFEVGRGRGGVRVTTLVTVACCKGVVVDIGMTHLALHLGPCVVLCQSNRIFSFEFVIKTVLIYRLGSFVLFWVEEILGTLSLHVEDSSLISFVLRLSTIEKVRRRLSPSIRHRCKSSAVDSCM